MSIYHLPGAQGVDRNIIGGKAWSVHRMQNLGIPVPPAFVIGTEVCAQFEQAGGKVPEAVLAALPDAVRWLEQQVGKQFGSGPRPLLVSVRSGAATSMPGMMDTVLNLGMTDAVQQSLAELTGLPEFAADVRQRFEQQYAHVVGQPAPNDPWQQLHQAIAAVFASWNSDRAVAYRRDRGLTTAGGTAVTVQAMVFGNLDAKSGTGVMFSRNPVDGTPAPYGEWLARGQGEDVVSGRHTPQSLAAMAEQMPEAHAELLRWSALLEKENRDIQDIEFTVESGKLWLLQSRAAKRSPAAAVRLAVAFKEEGLISASEALDRVTPAQIELLQKPHVDPAARHAAQVIASGKLACPGIASGILVTDVDEAERRALDGESIILARPTTNPDDVHAMTVVAGVLTELGGSTSHAAVVSREIGVPCIVGCGEGTLVPHDQQPITMIAEEAVVCVGELAMANPNESAQRELAALLSWARAEAGSQANSTASLSDLLRQRSK